MRARRPWFDLHDEAIIRPDVAILGLPYDGSASRRAGAAAAPARLREIAVTSDAITRRGLVVEGLTLRDFGDVSPGAAASQRAYLDEAARRIAALPDGAFPILIGGDNSVSIAGIEAFARAHGPDAGVVWFDAHPDLFASYDGNPDSHACALRRAMSLAGLSARRAVLLGTRSWSREEAAFIAREGIEVVPAADCPSESPGRVAARIARILSGAPAVYLSVDIDGFDPSCAPGTGYPMPGGVSAHWFFAFLKGLFETLPVRAMDITEIAPALDHNDVTSFLGAQLVLETLGALAGRSPSPANP